MTNTHEQSFKVGEQVLVKNLRDGPNYLVGLVVSKLGQVNYKVEVNGEV